MPFNPSKPFYKALKTATGGNEKKIRKAMHIMSSVEKKTGSKEAAGKAAMASTKEGLNEIFSLMESSVEKWTKEEIKEAEYKGRNVELNKPTRGDVKKFKVYVKDPKTGNVKKVNFGDPNMKIKKSDPDRRRSFRARHKCDQKKDKTTAGYWSCKKW